MCYDCIYLNKNKKQMERDGQYKFGCNMEGYTVKAIFKDAELKEIGCALFEKNKPLAGQTKMF